MALAVLNEVSLINGLIAAAADVFTRRGDVLFGIVIAEAAGVVDVVWENGQVSENVTTAAGGPLDLISAPAGSIAAYQGKIVLPLPAASGVNNVQSFEYKCEVVRGYARQRNGAGASADFLLLKNLSTGKLFESRPGDVEVIPGQ